MPTRLAAIDVGTNTALLVVADVDAGGHLEILHEAERFVRLGEGVDASGVITEAARQRLGEALHAYRSVAEQFRVDEILVGATSASRDATNRAALAAFVRRETGLRYEILSGEEEARWSFRGAVSAFPRLHGRCAVIDIGGGSTEFVVGEAGGDPAFRRSLDVGSVRLAERFFATQPPAPEAVARAEAFIRQTLDAAALPLGPAIPFIGAAGTVTSLALVAGRTASWAELGEAAVSLSAQAVRRWRERLLTLSFEEVLALNRAVMPGRADVFPAGVLILDKVMERFDLATCRVSPRSLRHGLLLRWAAGQAADPP